MKRLRCSIKYLPVSFVIGLLLAGSMAGSATAQDLAADRSVVHGQLSLAEAVKTATRESLVIRAARDDAQAAGADVKEARSMTLPQLSANTYLTAGNSTNILGTSPNVTPVNSLTVPTKPFADQNLTLMAPLYTGGRLESLVRSASDRRSAANDMVTGSLVDVALAVKTAYYRSLLASEMVKVAQARVDADTELVRNTTDRYQAGKDIISSVDRAQAELADAQQDLTSTTNDKAKANLDLRVAMGVSLDSDFSISDALMFTTLDGDLTSFLKQAGRYRPELLAAQASASAAGYDVGAARGSPRFMGLPWAMLFPGSRCLRDREARSV